MSFFGEPPPRPPEPPAEPPPGPAWHGPPRDELPVVVPLHLWLVHEDAAVVGVRSLAVFTTGFQVDLVARRPGEEDRLHTDFAEHIRLHEALARGELPDELLRLGLELGDGSRLTNVDRRPSYDEEPPGRVLAGWPGVGHDGAYDSRYWVWPLPPPGPIAFVCEWPAQDVPETRAQVDAALVLDAVAGVRSVWG